MSKELFREKGVAYDEYDVAANLERRQEMFTKSGQKGVPVITIAEADGSNEELIVGFDNKALLTALGLV